MRDNPRKAELNEALNQATSKSGEIPRVLDGASTAIGAKAWTGGTSGDFAAGLTEQSATAKRGGTASVEEVQYAYGHCRAEIEDTRTKGPQ